MSLNVHELNLGGETVTLRLTTKAIGSYVLKHGVEGAPPIVSVLNAIDDLGARCSLLTGALTHPDNRNKVKSGEDLLDRLADAGWNGTEVTDLILTLAHEAGLLSEENATRLSQAAEDNAASTMDKLVALLQGQEVKNGKAIGDAPTGAGDAENPM